MKQVNIQTIQESHKNMIYPIYKDQDICSCMSEVMEYDFNKIVHKEYNQITTIHTLGKYSFETITFVGLGFSKEMTTNRMRKVFEKVCHELKEEIVIALDNAVNENIDIHEVTRLFVESHVYAQYQEQVIGHDVKNIVDVEIMASEDVSEDIEIGKAYGEGINYARRLADTPSNFMTPTHLAKEAMNLAKQYGMECTILDKEKLEEMKAGGILSVNLGSHVPAYMICLKYNNANTPYTAVIGKGLTFDSGGYNIKSNSFGMKYDMCGGADVLGIMKILAATKAQANVYGIIPTTENLISDTAYKPQDVITTLSGKTVEIVSTDAEGRLILCDAITYAQQLGATRLIDLATLTGACVRALGNVHTGVFSNSDQYCQEFEKVAKECDEKVWRLPIGEEYLKDLKSKSADFKNSSGKTAGGACVAGSFLNEFVNNGIEWIHLDIAGTADVDGATGTMVRTVSHMLSK